MANALHLETYADTDEEALQKLLEIIKRDVCRKGYNYQFVINKTTNSIVDYKHS